MDRPIVAGTETLELALVLMSQELGEYGDHPLGADDPQRGNLGEPLIDVVVDVDRLLQVRYRRLIWHAVADHHFCGPVTQPAKRDLFGQVARRVNETLL